jgi:RNA polymerase sigma factor (sigma-70 family)
VVRTFEARDQSREERDVRESLDPDDVLARLLPSVHRWLYRLLPRAVVEDAVQDALIELSRALTTFRGDASLETWARRIVTRVAYRHYRQRRPSDEVYDDEAVAGASDPEDHALHNEALGRFRRLLDCLPVAQRVAFVLCDVEGLGHAEAASIEGVGLETLRTRLSRARSAISRAAADDPILRPFVTGGRS